MRCSKTREPFKGPCNPSRARHDAAYVKIVFSSKLDARQSEPENDSRGANRLHAIGEIMDGRQEQLQLD
jgi:hypothetical protein